MNWEAIGAVGEIVGALGVIVSLIYLSTQIRRSDQTARAESIRSVLDGFRVLAAHSFANAEVADLFAKGLTDFTSLDATEKRRFLYLFADNQAGTVHSLDPDSPDSSAQVIARGGQFGQLGITSILSDPGGDIYLTLLGSKERPSGEIVRLVPAGEAASLGLATDAETSPAESVATKFTSVCARCHGVDGRGERSSGPLDRDRCCRRR